MNHFRFRAVIGDSHYPMPIDVSRPQDIRNVQMALSFGTLLVMEAVNNTTYYDARWHDSMAAENSPTEFDLRPTDPALLHAPHLMYLPDGDLKCL